MSKPILNPSRREGLFKVWFLHILPFALVFFLPFGKGRDGLFAQTITVEQAVEIALKNNFSILISKGQSDISKNDVTLGNAGMLPNVALNASGSSANNSTEQNYASGLEVNRSGVISNNLNAGIALSWTLFDGMRMFATYDKLKELRTMGELNMKIQIENNIAGVITAYYDVVRQKQLIKATSQAITIFEERQKIAQARFEIGSGAKPEVLQAKVDVNEQRSQLLNLQSTLFNAKANLNQLMAREPETDFDTGDSIPFTYEPKYEELKSSVVKQNNGLLFAERNISVSNYTLREMRAQRFPVLGLNANYVFSRSENQAGFVLLNQNLGFNAGFFVSWNLFNGFEVNRQVKNAQMQTLISKLQYELAKNQVAVALATAYRNFVQAKDLLKLEEENYGIAKENADIALQSYKVGATSALVLKEAQRSFDEALTRLVNARYDTKAVETELMHLNGMLVK